jgi:hypothetical protein
LGDLTAYDSAWDVRGRAVAELTKAIDFDTPEGLKDAITLAAKIKLGRKEIDKFFDDEIKLARELLKTLSARKKAVEDPFIWADKYLRPKIAEKLKLIEEARRAEEARLKKLAEIQTASTVEEMQTSDPLAQEILSAPPAPMVPKEEIEGASTREDWKCEVFDLHKLVMAISYGRAPVKYVTADLVEIGKDVRRDKQTFSCPGVRTFKKTTAIIKAEKEGM